MMKRWLAITLSLVMILGLTACGDQPSNSGSTGQLSDSGTSGLPTDNTGINSETTSGDIQPGNSSSSTDQTMGKYRM